MTGTRETLIIGNREKIFSELFDRSGIGGEPGRLFRTRDVRLRSTGAAASPAARGYESTATSAFARVSRTRDAAVLDGVYPVAGGSQ